MFFNKIFCEKLSLIFTNLVIIFISEEWYISEFFLLAIFSKFFDKAVNTVNNFVDKVEDVLGFEDTSILYRYASGPSSILGIGRTTIRNFQNSKGNPSKFREDLNGDEKIYPLTINPLKTLGRVDELEPDIESLKLHRTKTDHISKKNYREVKYSTGNPGIINIKTKKYR